MTIIVIVLGIYMTTQFQTNKNKEPSKIDNPDIFSNISRGNDDQNQKSPKFQIDTNLFTIDGLDRFFDSIIELLRTGKVWDLVKNWFQKSKIELPFFYIGIGIVFLIFGELIFIFGVFIVIAYFVVKQIKVYRDKNPGFGSFSPSSLYAPQYSTYSANNFGTPSPMQSDYPEMMKSLLIPVLKRVGKYLWYLFLFVLFVGCIVYKFFLPSDIKKQIETEVLTCGLIFHL